MFSWLYALRQWKLTGRCTCTGYELPRIGLGVYQNNECKPACLAALKHGYKCAYTLFPSASSVGTGSINVFGRRRHIDSARMYRNEAKVGEALRESGVSRDQIFISQCSLLRVAMSEHLTPRMQHRRSTAENMASRRLLLP